MKLLKAITDDAIPSISSEGDELSVKAARIIFRQIALSGKRTISILSESIIPYFVEEFASNLKEVFI